jgi:Asp-tRNA(Asn)/Glu-tRNA(Gln) amidotransferase A subunit family amidase
MRRSILMSCGFRVEPFRPEGLEEARQLWWEFFGSSGRDDAWTYDSRGNVARPRVGAESDSSRVPGLDSRQRPTHTGESLLAAWLGRDAVREKILLQMRKYPVLICPVAAIPAFRHGEREWQVEGKTVKYLDAWSYCEWFNLLGFPAVVVPMGYSELKDLPIGVQIVGRPWEEEVVLAVAARLERECGAWRTPPPLG